jgi:hypothetical protein
MSGTFSAVLGLSILGTTCNEKYKRMKNQLHLH